MRRAMKQQQITPNRPWTLVEEGQIQELSKKGMPPERIARVVGRTPKGVKNRLAFIRMEKTKKSREGLVPSPGAYVVKLTDFSVGSVTTFREVLIGAHGNSSLAWKYTMRFIEKCNKKAKEEKQNKFYWVKYM